MTPFNIPKPPAPRPGEALDFNGWSLWLQWHALQQAHEIATVREASDAANVAAQKELGEAMKAAAAIQLQAVTAPEAPDSRDKMLQKLVVALTAAGVDSACVLPQAQAILAATTPREMPAQVLPRPAG
jgi:hypothetical protein